MTDQAVWKRLQRCMPFLAALLKQQLALGELPPLPQHLRFLAGDGTTVECPGATGADYRLHLVINLVNLRFHEVHISTDKQGESLKHYHLQAGDVAVVDQGYCSYAGILDAVYDQGADVIVRWNHHRPFYDPQHKRRALELCATLKGQPPGSLRSFPVLLPYTATSKQKDTRELVGSLHVYRMTTKEAQEARKRVSRKHQKTQRVISEKTLFLRQFVIVFTSLAPEILSGETVFAIYRCRWHIALAIKRMQSLINLNKLRAKRGSKLAEVYRYGKILYLLCIEHDMRSTFGYAWGGVDLERRSTWWRLYKLLKARLDAVLLARWAWKAEAVAACLHVLMERPRKRKLQRLPRWAVALQHGLTAFAETA